MSVFKQASQLFGRALLQCLLVFSLPSIVVAQQEPNVEPRNFVFVGGDRVSDHRELISRPDIEGAQVIYSWRSLEPNYGIYDFTAIEEDLRELDAIDKRLWVQVQDRFFLPTARRVPDYILTDPKYGGGLARQYDNAGEGKPKGSGWTTKQWNPHVRERFQALLLALADRFDGRIYGINLPESAFDQAGDTGADTDFTCEKYFDSALENMGVLGAAFQKSLVVQYVNFWPCEWNNNRQFMERTFDLAVEEGIGLGGPDIIPFRQGQMRNSYPFFNRHHRRLPVVAMAVQGPTLTYTNPRTGNPFTRGDFVDFAMNYLGVDIIFWSKTAPWLKSEAQSNSK